MTDYNLLAKDEIEKYYNMTTWEDLAQEVAAQAQQDIIDELEKMPTNLGKEFHYLKDRITYLHNLKEAILNYKQ